MNSVHILSMVNSIIRSLLNYACHLFIKANPFSINSRGYLQYRPPRCHWFFEVCTYSPPPLRHEENTCSVDSRIRSMAHRFLDFQLSLPHTPFSAHSATGSGNLSAGAADLFARYDIEPRHILQLSWPVHLLFNSIFFISVDGLPFHTVFRPSGGHFSNLVFMLCL